MPMLRFLTVGTYRRTSRTLIVVCAIGSWLLIARVLAQAPAEFEDLLPELAAKISSVVPFDSQVTLAASAPDSSSTTASRLQEALGKLLAPYRVRVVDAGAVVATVDISCAANLRERSCVAEVATDARRDVVIVTRRHEGAPEPENRPVLSLELQSLVARRTPILDVANLGDRILILDAHSVALHQRTAQGWQPVSSRPLPVVRTWPRDLRGRLRVDGDQVSAFLPGIACSGRLSSLSLDCVDSRQPWPLGIENTGLEPARNYFSTPEGVQFYNVAALGNDADARWIIADRNGGLSLLGDSRQLLTRVATGNDVTGIMATCAGENYVVASEVAGEQEAVRLFQVVRRRLVPISAPVFVTGKLTALWSAPGVTAATAIAHDMSGGRYEAFLATVSCGR
jgi:hypothetical protein